MKDKIIYYADKQNQAAFVSSMITEGVGGKENISRIDCGPSSLRIMLLKPEKVDEGLLKASNASGILREKNMVQIIYGSRAPIIKSNLDDYLDQL